jgi:ribonuclease Z
VYSPLSKTKYLGPKAQLDTTHLISPGAHTYCANGY